MTNAFEGPAWDSAISEGKAGVEEYLDVVRQGVLTKFPAFPPPMKSLRGLPDPSCSHYNTCMRRQILHTVMEQLDSIERSYNHASEIKISLTHIPGALLKATEQSRFLLDALEPVIPPGFSRLALSSEEEAQLVEDTFIQGLKLPPKAEGFQMGQETIRIVSHACLRARHPHGMPWRSARGYSPADKVIEPPAPVKRSILNRFFRNTRSHKTEPPQT